MEYFKRLFALPLCALCLCGSGTRSEVRDDFGRYFRERGVTGAFVLYDAKKDRYIRYNAAGCRKGYLPASTFKIFNSLAGLESGIISGPDFTLKWDGVRRGNPVWDRDHDLASAVKYSAIWYFQEIARRIGKRRMARYLELTGYGNGNISAGIDCFWLKGKFRVSPDGQVEFLRKMYYGGVPFSKKNIDIVKSILVERPCGRTVVRAKTGLYMSGRKAAGWWIGFAEHRGSPFFFATHITGRRVDDDFIKARMEITEKILSDLGFCGP